MAIFDFLIKNIYIVIIILFALSRLFKKSAGGTKPQGRMPDFSGGDAGKPGQARKEAGPFQPAQGQPRATRPQPRAQQIDEQQRWDEEGYSQVDLQTVYRTRLKQEEQPKRETETKSRSPFGKMSEPIQKKQPPLVSPSARRSSFRLSKPSSSNLREAVIWSEVLGPPRAKRSLRK
ncbi:hypothetical protein [Paenibacillus sp. HB172176]|uniref:hypothetical protein n=1 Tax=Paenibacillus sp. HB172176 TaxID=2493690 RepID=UPI00143B3632|nr:hypothetical protein [Paenibacillus sp. HB172176]